jgi:hypothetical protein
VLGRPGCRPRSGRRSAPRSGTGPGPLRRRPRRRAGAPTGCRR